jgi:hypothetical protein
MWLFVTTDVSEEHIASIFRMKRLQALLVCSKDVPHDGWEESDIFNGATADQL